MVLEEYWPSWLYPKERDSAGNVGSQKSLPLFKHSLRSCSKSCLLKGMALSLPPSPSSLSFLLASTWAMLDILTQAWSRVVVLTERGESRERLLHGAAWRSLCWDVEGWRVDGGERGVAGISLPVCRSCAIWWMNWMNIAHERTWMSAGMKVYGETKERVSLQYLLSISTKCSSGKRCWPFRTGAGPSFSNVTNTHIKI